MSVKTMNFWKWLLLLVASFALSFMMYAMAQTVTGFVGAEWLKWLLSIAVSVAMLALYAVFVNWFEKHPAEDIPMSRLLPDISKGMGIGLGYFVVLVLIMMLSGVYHIDSFGTDRPLQVLTAFMMFLYVGVGEEIIFRGVLFRWIDEKWGFVAAMVVSSLLFGLLHIFQPGATWWSSLAIAIEAGLLLGAAYKYSGTLWLPIGIHWAWNFTQGNIFGFEVSGGNAGASLVNATVSGPDILTGGAFGAEASALAPVLGLLLSAWFIIKIVRR